MSFIKGMDVSSYQEMLDRGYVYYDEAGNEVDILEYAVKKGFKAWSRKSSLRDAK